MVEKFPATFQYPEHLGNSHMIDLIRLHYDVRSQFGHFHSTVPEVPTHVETVVLLSQLKQKPDD